MFGTKPNFALKELGFLLTCSVKIFKKFSNTVERFRSDLSAVIIINAREIKLPRKKVQIFVGGFGNS